MSAVRVFCSSAVSPLERKNHGNIYNMEYSEKTLRIGFSVSSNNNAHFGAAFSVVLVK